MTSIHSKLQRLNRTVYRTLTTSPSQEQQSPFAATETDVYIDMEYWATVQKCIELKNRLLSTGWRLDESLGPLALTPSLQPTEDELFWDMEYYASVQRCKELKDMATTLK